MSAQQNSLAQGVETLIFKLKNQQQRDQHERDGMADFDVVIIGSGYGGAVAASRLARAKDSNGQPLRVCVLERGFEFLPGDFPADLSLLPGQLRAQTKNGAVGNPKGLFDFHLNDDIGVLRASGLGGGSLINASVAERPVTAVWQAPEWPAKLRTEASNGKLDRYYEMAERMLAVQKIAADKWPQKTIQLQKLGEAIDGEDGEASPDKRSFRAVNLTLNQQDCVNAYGIEQKACVACGDCFTGCNFNAKNTLTTNYLPDAKRFGAQIFTGANVLYLQQAEGGSADVPADISRDWLVHFQLTDSPNDNARHQQYTLRSKMVVLAAGTLGSSEILMRSKEHGLKLSKELGAKFSGNGDMLWAGYNQRSAVTPGTPQATPYAERQVGPTITAMLDLRSDPHHPRVIQDAAVPASLFRLFGELISTTNLLYRMAKPCASESNLRSDPDAVNFEHLQHSAVYLTMGRDGAHGKLEFVEPQDMATAEISANASPAYAGSNWGRLQIVWPDAAKLPFYAATEQGLMAGVEKLGGTLLPSPQWRAFPQVLEGALSGKKPNGVLLTVHPLGGCAMADNVQQGVVNHEGAVFNRKTARSVYPGLYVWDGAIIPCAVGINPLLTITALAERAVALCAKRQKWQIDYQAPLPAANAHNATALLLQPPKRRVKQKNRGQLYRGDARAVDAVGQAAA